MLSSWHPSPTVGSRQGAVQAALLASTALQPAGKTINTSYKLVMQTCPIQSCPISTTILNFSTIVNALYTHGVHDGVASQLYECFADS